MNPSTTAPHAYETDLDAHNAFREALQARMIDCAATADQAMTKQESFYWNQRVKYMSMVLSMITATGGKKLPRDETSTARARVKSTVMKSLTEMMDRAHTTTEKETIQGCMEGVEEALSLHASITGIF
jgi:hypothetical protein